VTIWPGFRITRITLTCLFATPGRFPDTALQTDRTSTSRFLLFTSAVSALSLTAISSSSKSGVSPQISDTTKFLLSSLLLPSTESLLFKSPLRSKATYFFPSLFSLVDSSSPSSNLINNDCLHQPSTSLIIQRQPSQCFVDSAQLSQRTRLTQLPSKAWGKYLNLIWLFILTPIVTSSTTKMRSETSVTRRPTSSSSSPRTTDTTAFSASQ
jgi:hypothetical protein